MARSVLVINLEGAVEDTNSTYEVQKKVPKGRALQVGVWGSG